MCNFEAGAIERDLGCRAFRYISFETWRIPEMPLKPSPESES
jgi:hypothetical protein